MADTWEPKHYATWSAAWLAGGAFAWLWSRDVHATLLVLAVGVAYLFVLPGLQRFQWSRSHLRVSLAVYVAIIAVAFLPLPNWLSGVVLAASLGALVWIYHATALPRRQP